MEFIVKTINLVQEPLSNKWTSVNEWPVCRAIYRLVGKQGSWLEELTSKDRCMLCKLYTASQPWLSLWATGANTTEASINSKCRLLWCLLHEGGWHEELLNINTQVDVYTCFWLLLHCVLLHLVLLIEYFVVFLVFCSQWTSRPVDSKSYCPPPQKLLARIFSPI